MLSTASTSPSARLGATVADVVAAPELGKVLRELSLKPADDTEMQVLQCLFSAINSTFTSNLRDDAVTIDLAAEATLPANSYAVAVGRRAEWTLALGIGCNALDWVRQEALEVLKETHRDQVFWRQRVGAPLQELIEQGPWGWLLSVQGSAPITPSKHAKQLATLSVPLFVAVGAVTRARDLVLGTLDYCVEAASVVLPPPASPSAPDGMQDARRTGPTRLPQQPQPQLGSRHSSRRSRLTDDETYSQVAHGAMSMSSSGLLGSTGSLNGFENLPPIATPPTVAASAYGVASDDQDSSSSQPISQLPVSALFSSNGRPVTAMSTMLSVIVSTLCGCVATLAACKEAGVDSKFKAQKALDDWAMLSQKSLVASQLLDLLQQARKIITLLLDDIKMAAALHRRRWGPLRNWHRVSAAGFVVIAGGWALWKQRNNLGTLASETAQSVTAFVHRHLIIPASDMADELLSGNKRTISDAGALAATRQSLQTILEDYYTHNPQVLSAAGAVERSAGREAVAAAAKRFAAIQDVGPAEMQFAEEMRRPVVSSVAGTLPQLVLMQMAKLRVEALTLMNAMDSLIKSNDFTARMASIMPFVAMTATGLYLLRLAGQTIFRPIPTAELKHSVLLCVWDIDRLLSLAANAADQRFSAQQRMHDNTHRHLMPMMHQSGGIRRTSVAAAAAAGSGVLPSPRASAADGTGAGPSPMTAAAASAAAAAASSTAPALSLATQGLEDSDSTEQPPQSPGLLLAANSVAEATDSSPTTPIRLPRGHSEGTVWQSPLHLASTAASAARQLRRASSIGSVGTGRFDGGTGGKLGGHMDRAHTAGMMEDDTASSSREVLAVLLEEQIVQPNADESGDGLKSSCHAGSQSQRQKRSNSSSTGALDVAMHSQPTVHSPPSSLHLDMTQSNLRELQGGLGTLTLGQLGSLELRIQRLRELLILLSVVLHEEELARLDEDLADLAADDLSAAQRLDILRRMRCTYAFLTPTHRDEPLTSLFGLRLLG